MFGFREEKGGRMLKIQVFFSTSWKQTAYQAVSLGAYSIANLDISETLRSNFHHIFRLSCVLKPPGPEPKNISLFLCFIYHSTWLDG